MSSPRVTVGDLPHYRALMHAPQAQVSDSPNNNEVTPFSAVSKTKPFGRIVCHRKMRFPGAKKRELILGVRLGGILSKRAGGAGSDSPNNNEVTPFSAAPVIAQTAHTPGAKKKALVLGAKGRSILSARTRRVEVFEPLSNNEGTLFSAASKTKPFTSRHLSF